MHVKVRALLPRATPGAARLATTWNEPVTDISVRFWGTRGSVACAGRETERYGGNTSCVEVRCGDRLFIFDAGTGLRLLGNALVESASPVEADIFLSHCHLDHISGLPFFAPCYRASSRLRLWAGNLLPEFELEQVLGMLIAEPFFPAGVAILAAGIEFQDFRVGDLLRPHDAVTLRTAPLNHPGRATGYRLDHDGRSIAYVTDTEHCPGRLDQNVLGLAKGVDLLIYDSSYTDEEFPARIGRGHSTWQEGVRIAEAAGARTLAIFHHDPEHDDRFLDRVAAEAAAMRPGTIVAADGMTLAI